MLNYRAFRFNDTTTTFPFILLHVKEISLTNPQKPAAQDNKQLKNDFPKPTFSSYAINQSSFSILFKHLSVAKEMQYTL